MYSVTTITKKINTKLKSCVTVSTFIDKNKGVITINSTSYTTANINNIIKFVVTGNTFLLTVKKPHS